MNCTSAMECPALPNSKAGHLGHLLLNSMVHSGFLDAGFSSHDDYDEDDDDNNPSGSQDRSSRQAWS